MKVVSEKKDTIMSFIISHIKLRRFWWNLVRSFLNIFAIISWFVGNIYEKVFKILITDLDELKQRLRTECDKLDHVVIAAAIRQWYRR